MRPICDFSIFFLNSIIPQACSIIILQEESVNLGFFCLKEEDYSKSEQHLLKCLYLIGFVFKHYL